MDDVDLKRHHSKHLQNVAIMHMTQLRQDKMYPFVKIYSRIQRLLPKNLIVECFGNNHAKILSAKYVQIFNLCIQNGNVLLS